MTASGTLVAEPPTAVGPTSDVADARVPAVESGYRPHLDGLRTIAVYLVVAFHAGADRLSGGFIGVDMFFVLSGYLVTSLLLRDLRAGGRIRLSRFYSRRFRRLLPASFVTLLVTAVVFTAVASPLEISNGLRSIQAAFLYVANWFFIRESADYFAANVDSSPVVHFWSLAIEEQFYLVWPLALTLLYRTTRRFGPRQWRVVRAIVIVAGLVSAVVALRISGADLSRAYYGTGTRAYQLLAGCLVALTPRLVFIARRSVRASQVAALAGLGGLIVLGTSVIDLNPIRRGVVVAVLTAGLLVALEASAGGLGKRLLSLGPITYLGRISYGTYLWHWPIIVVAVSVSEMTPISLFLLASLTATGIASLSYQVLESPVRASAVLDRFARPVVVVGLALSLLGALVLAPAVLREDSGGDRVVAAASSAGGTPVPTDIDWDAVLADRAGGHDCTDREPEWCTLVEGFPEGQHILLMGDSHAEMLVPLFTILAKERGDTFSATARNSCPWQQSLTFGPVKAAECLGDKAEIMDRVIPALDPDVVILAERTFDDPTNTVALTTGDGTVVRRGEPGYEDAVRSASAETVDRLRRDGRKVVIVEPIPYPAEEDDPLRCLSGAEVTEECRYVASPGPLPTEQIFRDLAAADDGVWSIDIDGLACPYLPICDPIVNGTVVKFDEGHLTPPYARSIAPAVETLLVDNGILT